MSRPRLFLIDTFGFIFRAYHARARISAPTMRTTTGIPSEAVYIFNNMLRKLTAAYTPEYLAAVFESAGPTFREQEFAEYKANRSEMPEELAQQIPYIRRLIEGMRIPILEYPGFEADDVIGAIARRAEESGSDVAIVSSDKDMLQLVGEHVQMYNPVQEDLWYDAAKVEEKMGVHPGQVADLLALKGDAIDNIPGAPGIGDKGAREILARFGSVEAALDRAAELADKGYGKRYRESLQQNRERIEMSKRLAMIDTKVPIAFHLAKPQIAAAGHGGVEAHLQGARVLQPARSARPGRGHAPSRLCHARFGGSRGCLPSRHSGRRTGCGDGGSRPAPEIRRCSTRRLNPHRPRVAARTGAGRAGIADRAAPAGARRRLGPESGARRQAGLVGAGPLGHRVARFRT